MKLKVKITGPKVTLGEIKGLREDIQFSRDMRFNSDRSNLTFGR